jgi:hypothetical protein
MISSGSSNAMIQVIGIFPGSCILAVLVIWQCNCSSICRHSRRRGRDPKRIDQTAPNTQVVCPKLAAKKPGLRELAEGKFIHESVTKKAAKKHAAMKRRIGFREK